jgi:hypothetical protein
MALHAVAEQVLATALHEATGRIGLRVAPGGFATPVVDRPGPWTRLAVDGLELVIRSNDDEQRSPLTTIADAARAVGLDQPGMPPEVYAPVTRTPRDEPLTLDARAAGEVATVLGVGAAALDRLRGELADASATIVQLWPEHFDAATTIAEVNFGVSPGDDDHPLPYLYVGPWSPPSPDGAYWNEPFGASRTVDARTTVDDALAFFHEGRRRAAEAHLV